MHNIGDIGSLFLSMPPNLQDAETEAFCYAVDRQMAKITALAERLNVWSNLDGLNPKHYDIAATCLQIPYYRSDMTDEQKLSLIKKAPLLRKYAGTKRGVGEFLDTMFSNWQYLPWYEYGGQPYHFKIRTDDARTFDIEKLFLEMLRRIKAARSVLDAVETIRETGHKRHIAPVVSEAYVAPYIGLDEKPVMAAKRTVAVGAAETYHAKEIGLGEG